jgi:hypothetical protein
MIDRPAAGYYPAIGLVMPGAPDGSLFAAQSQTYNGKDFALSNDTLPGFSNRSGRTRRGGVSERYRAWRARIAKVGEIQAADEAGFGEPEQREGRLRYLVRGLAVLGFTWDFAWDPPGFGLGFSGFPGFSGLNWRMAMECFQWVRVAGKSETTFSPRRISISTGFYTGYS